MYHTHHIELGRMDLADELSTHWFGEYGRLSYAEWLVQCRFQGQLVLFLKSNREGMASCREMTVGLTCIISSRKLQHLGPSLRRLLSRGINLHYFVWCLDRIIRLTTYAVSSIHQIKGWWQELGALSLTILGRSKSSA
jgi:hypothetical protein